MRYTDLVGATVYASDGERIGKVHDVGFQRCRLADGRTEFRLISLECSDSLAIGHRFGFGTGDMAGPWPLDRIFGVLRRRSVRIVAWGHVARTRPGRIDLRRTRTDLEEAEEGRA